MPKTTTAKRSFKIVDLIRERKSFEYIEVPAYPVEVAIEVTTTSALTTPKPAPSAVFDRLEDVARAKLEEYETTITTELVKIEAKIKQLMSQPDAEAMKQALDMISATTATVKKALDSAVPAAETAVEKRLEKEAQGDKLLTEARVKTAVKVASGVISLGANAAKLAATYGADVTSYLSIAKTLLGLGLELKQQLKGEAQLRKDLEDGVKAFLETRESSITQAAVRQKLTVKGAIPKNPVQAVQFIAKGVVAAGEEVSRGRDAGAVAKEVLDFVVKQIKAKLNDVEAARVAYRNHTVKMRQKVDSLSEKADELSAAMKAARNLKDGVKIGAQCMQLKSTVRGMAAALQDAENFLEEMQDVMKAGGMECDDSTVIQKLKKLDVSTILSGGESAAELAKDIYDLVSSVAGAVH